MVASDSKQSTRAGRATGDCLSAPELEIRLDEEVSRAERHRTTLSCLLMKLDDAEELAQAHGTTLPERALVYLAATVGRQLRRFDRVGRPTDDELLVLLPGADERRGEIVARRVLGRMRSIKIEIDDERRPLRVSIGLAAWHEGLSARDLLEQARAAAQVEGHDGTAERGSDGDGRREGH